MAEHPYQGCSDHHAGRSKKGRLPHYRLHGLPASAEAAIKHYEYQAYRTSLLGEVVIVETYLPKPVISEQHAQHHECKKCRNAYARRHGIQPDVCQDDNGYEYQEQSRHCNVFKAQSDRMRTKIIIFIAIAKASEAAFPQQPCLFIGYFEYLCIYVFKSPGI